MTAARRGRADEADDLLQLLLANACDALGTSTEGIALVEWAERLGALLPGDRLTVRLSIEGDGRRAELEGGKRWTDVRA